MMNYTERINRLATRRTTSEAQEIAWVSLMAHMAALLANAADHGHVTNATHRKVEELIMEAEVKMGATP